MFYARIFEKGVDQSFVELSQFLREGKVWRYSSGTVVPTAELPPALETLRLAGCAPQGRHTSLTDTK